MDDESKLALHDALLAYLYQSSNAMNKTARALAPDPLQSDVVVVLNESLNTAKVLLSKVIRPSSHTK
jgi:hypothetical protein